MEGPAPSTESCRAFSLLIESGSLVAMFISIRHRVIQPVRFTQVDASLYSRCSCKKSWNTSL